MRDFILLICVQETAYAVKYIYRAEYLRIIETQSVK